MPFATCAISVSDVRQRQKWYAFFKIGAKSDGKKKVRDQSKNCVKM